MRYFTIQEARRLAKSETTYRTVQKILKEEAEKHTSYQTYDVFLSHAFSDAELILGAKRILEKEGFKVYVDWIEDKNLDRSNVTRDVANHIRNRMKSCRNLVYAASENSQKSNWMPWELGYFDGHKPGHVYVLPLMESERETFKGREYLSLYPVLGEEVPVNLLGSSRRRGFKVLDGTSTGFLAAAA